MYSRKVLPGLDLALDKLSHIWYRSISQRHGAHHSPEFESGYNKQWSLIGTWLIGAVVTPVRVYESHRPVPLQT